MRRGGQSERDHHDAPGGEEGARPAHDCAGEPAPERAAACAARDPVAEQREERRLQRQGRGDRDERD